ncbi:hypothetical protein K439DRAFT_1619094 [Ramaria rubella]|nr:hypothetical protein K439DRAFT_1619094 [Ramaria rubella]
MSDIKLTEKSVGILKVGNWLSWSRKCKAVLRAQGVWNLIEGDNTTTPMDPVELLEWNRSNDCIVGTLCQVVDDPLMQQIEKFVMAKEAWNHLKSKTHQAGIVSKLNALHTATHTRFVPPSTFTATILKIKDLIATIYDDKEPTREE